MDKERYNELVDTAVKRAWNSMGQFFKLYDFNPALFKHLFEIDVKISDEKNDSNSKYPSKEENYIILYSDYIDGLIAGLDEGRYSKQYVINDIATTVIHEVIHANRSVFVKDGCVTYIDEEYDSEPAVVDENYLNYLLSSVISDEEYFNSYVVVPIRVDYLGEDMYTVYAYNNVTNQYHIYENQQFRSSNIHEIADELNTNRLRYTPTKTFACTRKFESIDYDSQEEAIDVEISSADYLEECLVEVIAKYILYSRKSKQFNLDAFVLSIEAEDTLPEYKLAAKMLAKMGEEVILWFILSYYDDFYDKKTYDKLKAKYDEVFEEFNKLASEDEQIMVDQMVVSVTNILENSLY